jgi:hypothetical protein
MVDIFNCFQLLIICMFDRSDLDFQYDGRACLIIVAAKTSNLLR